MGKDEDKAKRLAEALRENLRKRKAQARAMKVQVKGSLHYPSDGPPPRSGAD